MKKKIGLVNLEPKYTNIALEKIRMYYRIKGHEVEDYLALLSEEYDKIFVSSIFTFTDKSIYWDPKKARIGGSGYDLTTNLPEEIDKMKPKINIGFTMRGCIRKCPWCVVPKKEGKARPTGDIYDFWDGKANHIIILDNNILALPEHFKKICAQLREAKVSSDWNQGLDIRLLTDDSIKELKSIRHKDSFKFAWDGPEDWTGKFEKLNNAIGSCIVLVMVGHSATTFAWSLKKIHILKDMLHRPFVMKYEQARQDIRYITLSQWTNGREIFFTNTWEEFLLSRDRLRESREWHDESKNWQISKA